MGNSKTTQAVAKIMAYFPQTHSKFPLLKKTPTQLIEHEEDKLGHTQSLHLSLLEYLVQEDIRMLPKGNINKSPTNPLFYHGILTEKNQGNGGAQLVGVTKQ